MPAEVTRSEPLPKIPHVDAYKRLMGRKGSRITLLQRISKTTMVVNSTDVAVRGQSTAVEAGIQLLRETFDDWKKGGGSAYVLAWTEQVNVGTRVDSVCH